MNTNDLNRRIRECANEIFNLTQGIELNETKGKCEQAKYVWMVSSPDYPCDIRRYAFSHSHAISQVENPTKNWGLYKLVRANKRKAK